MGPTLEIYSLEQRTAIVAIILIGFMGAGKTTLARTLAQQHRLTFIDTDELLGRQFQTTTGNLFNQVGEEKFRRLEFETLRQTLSTDVPIVATGGGIVESSESRRLLQQAATVFWLNVDYSTCYRRIAADTTRPLVTQSTSDALYQRFCQRESIYRQVATHEITATKKSPRQLAEEIWQLKTS